MKLLGVKWKPLDDQLVCDLSSLRDITAMKPTKRNVIGLSARIYDPLGLLSPITVQFKMPFQDGCVARLNWDEMLSGVLLTKWNCLLLGLEQSRTLCIPRCYFDSFTGTDTLHSSVLLR